MTTRISEIIPLYVRHTFLFSNREGNYSCLLREPGLLCVCPYTWYSKVLSLKPYEEFDQNGVLQKTDL